MSHIVTPHPSTERSADDPYGCYNGDRTSPGYYGLGRTFVGGGRWETTQVFIENTLSRDCKHDRRTTDQRCGGCKHIGDQT